MHNALLSVEVPQSYSNCGRLSHSGRHCLCKSPRMTHSYTIFFWLCIFCQQSATVHCYCVLCVIVGDIVYASLPEWHILLKCSYTLLKLFINTISILSSFSSYYTYRIPTYWNTYSSQSFANFSNLCFLNYYPLPS